MTPFPAKPALWALILVAASGCAALPPPSNRCAPPDWPSAGSSALCNPQASAAARLSPASGGLEATSDRGGYLSAWLFGDGRTTPLATNRPVTAGEAVLLPVGPARAHLADALAVYTNNELDADGVEDAPPVTAANLLSVALRKLAPGDWWSAATTIEARSLK